METTKYYLIEVDPFSVCSAERPTLEDAKDALQERWKNVGKTDAREDGTFEKSYLLDTQAFAVGKFGTYRWLILPKS